MRSATPSASIIHSPTGSASLVVPAAEANQRYSIMAYNRYSGATIEAYAPMLYDILAIQYIYGANMETNKGDNVYQFATDKEYLECIWDASGHDTFDLSLQSRNQVIDLRAGTFSSVGIKNNGQTGNGNVSIAFNVTIEDAIGGSGHDKITGNNAANFLRGGRGNDTLDGGDGIDKLDGESGNDMMTGGKGSDTYDRQLRRRHCERTGAEQPPAAAPIPSKAPSPSASRRAPTSSI